jgi:hypothetical protein
MDLWYGPQAFGPRQAIAAAIYPKRRKHQGASNKYQKPSLSYLLFIFLLKYLPLLYPESPTVVAYLLP